MIELIVEMVDLLMELSTGFGHECWVVVFKHIFLTFQLLENDALFGLEKLEVADTPTVENVLNFFAEFAVTGLDFVTTEWGKRQDGF